MTDPVPSLASFAPPVVQQSPFVPLSPLVRSRRLGAVAMIVGLSVLVLSVTASVLLGIASAPYAQHDATSFHVNLATGSANPEVARLAELGMLQVVLGTALGVWAFVQAIVAMAQRRGRAFGVVAVVASVLAPLFSGIAMLVSLGSTLAAG